MAVRTLRAYVNYRVPEHFFNRTSIAVQDFTYLAERYEKEPGILPAGSYWEILYHLGKAHQTLEEHEQAKAVWQKLIAANPSRKYLRLLRAEGMDVGEIEEDADGPGAPVSCRKGSHSTTGDSTAINPPLKRPSASLKRWSRSTLTTLCSRRMTAAASHWWPALQTMPKTPLPAPSKG